MVNRLDLLLFSTCKIITNDCRFDLYVAISGVLTHVKENDTSIFVKINKQDE